MSRFCAFSDLKLIFNPHSQLSERRQQVPQEGRRSSHLRFFRRQFKHPVLVLVRFLMAGEGRGVPLSTDESSILGECSRNVMFGGRWRRVGRTAGEQIPLERGNSTPSLNLWRRPFMDKIGAISTGAGTRPIYLLSARRLSVQLLGLLEALSQVSN